MVARWYLDYGIFGGTVQSKERKHKSRLDGVFSMDVDEVTFWNEVDATVSSYTLDDLFVRACIDIEGLRQGLADRIAMTVALNELDPRVAELVRRYAQADTLKDWPNVDLS